LNLECTTASKVSGKQIVAIHKIIDKLMNTIPPDHVARVQTVVVDLYENICEKGGEAAAAKCGVTVVVHTQQEKNNSRPIHNAINNITRSLEVEIAKRKLRIRTVTLISKPRRSNTG
jgi:hypothetical protein